MWDLIVSVPDHCLSFYFSCTRVPGEPPGDTTVALGYKWCQQEILSDTRVSLQPTGYTVVAQGTSGATRRYCGNTKVPVEPSGYTLATLVYLWSQPKIQ